MEDDFLENCPFALVPSEEEGQTKSTKFELGTPIACSTYKPTWQPNKPLRFDDDIETLPIKNLKYNLTHMKETKNKTQTLAIGLEIILKTIIGLNLNIGSVQYNTKYTSNLSTEHLQISYYREEKVERLLPTVEALEIIEEGYDDVFIGEPTHIITEVYYGVHMVANLLIRTQESEKLVNKTASGIGALVIGPISAGIEAALKAVLDNKPAGVEIEIDIEVNVEIPTENKDIKTADQLFKFIKYLDTIKPDEMQPLKMFCVPISQFLPNRAPTKGEVPVIPNFFLEPLNQMVATLHDYQDSETVARIRGKSIVGPKIPASHFLKRVMQGDSRLRNILDDKENEITKSVLEKQTEWNSKAVDLYERATGLIKNTKTTTKEIIELLDTYKEEFDITQLNENVNGFITSGKEQLSLINADDVNEFTLAKFVASNFGLSKLLDRRDTKASVVLETRQEDDLESQPPNGLFLAAYNLSASTQLDVIVVMPNASKKFSLTFKAQEQEQEFEDFQDIIRALEILSVATGVSGGPAGRWYQALASREEIPFPIVGEFDSKFFAFFRNTMSDYKDVQIYPTFMSLKTHLMNVEQKNVSICLSSSLIPLQVGAEAFIRLFKNSALSHDKFDFIVCDFELFVDEDGPLLVVFMGGELKAVCLDWLDFLRLETILISGQLDFSILMNNASTFFPKRIEIYLQLRELFQFSLFQKSTLVHHPDVLFIENKEVVDTAIEICSAYLTIEKREERMVTALTKRLLILQPSYLTQLQEVGWSDSQSLFHYPEIFYEDRRRDIRALYLNLLFGCSCLLINLGALVHTLDFSLQTFKADKDNIDAFTDLNKMISDKFLDEFDVIDSEIVPRLKAELTSSINKDNVEQAERALKIAQEELLFSKGFASADEADVILHLQSILSIIPPIVVEEDKPPAEEITRRSLRWKAGSEDAFHDIVSTFVNAAVGTDDVIQDWLSKRLVLKVLNKLSTLRYPEWHQKISEQFRNLTKIDDFEGLISTVEMLRSYNELFRKKDQYFLWSNPPFKLIVFDALSVDGDPYSQYSKPIFDAVKQEEDEYVSLPPYIPAKIARILRADHLYKDKDENIRQIRQKELFRLKNVIQPARI